MKVCPIVNVGLCLRDYPSMSLSLYVLQDQLNQGIIEAIQPDDTPPGAVDYLTHHAIVHRDNTTTKVRVVYDASARSANGPSLNDCLLKAPKFNQLIFDPVVRFRS